METINKKNPLPTIVIYASVWGLMEASLGWLLHFVPFPVAGLIMFPLAMTLLNSAYKKLQSPGALVLISFIAAAIKLVDFALPGLPFLKIINPAVALLIEGSVAALIIPFLAKTKGPKALIPAALANFGWRIGFLVYVFALNHLGGFPIAILQSTESLLNFFLLGGAVGTLLSWGLWLLQGSESDGWALNLPKPALWAPTLFALAIGLQVLV